MDIWIIQDGEKVGPIHDYEIRSRIERGELPPATPAWHEGLPAWKPLAEIGLFEREFARPPEVPDLPPPLPDLPAARGARGAAPPQLDPPVLIRRFFARWFDLYVYAGVWWLAMWACGGDIGSTLRNPWIILFQYVPWFLVETVLLHRYGTTPGKWLLGLRVVNNDTSLLTPGQALRRSARVLFIGLGFGWGVLTLICQIMAYITAVRFGRPLWDHAAGHRVMPRPLLPLRIVTYVLAIYGAIQLQMMVVWPYVMPFVLEALQPFPAVKEQLEKNPPWHLPPRH